MADDLFAGEDDFELPDAREVNRRIREDERKRKLAEKRAQTGEGMLMRALKEARAQHAGDPQQQLGYILAERNIPAAVGRKRTVGDKRFADLRVYMRTFIALLPQLRCPIQNLTELGSAHVLALARRWERDALGEGTIQGYFSILRRFFSLIGKPKMVPEGQALYAWLKANGVTSGTAGRQYIPTYAKAWRAKKVDPERVIREVREMGEEVVACQMEMMLAWGLRVNEAIEMQPQVADKGDALLVTRGTKGGKTRTVRYFRDTKRAAYQREVLERAKKVAQSHPKGELAIPRMTRKKSHTHFNWVMQKVGVTAGQLKVTPHGLRHQFAVDLFEDLSGMPAPVLALLPAAAYRHNQKLVDETYLEISRQMGHERKSITGAYNGTVANLEKGQLKRITRWLDQLDAAGPALVGADVAEAWMVGTCGFGGVLRPGDPMALAIRLKEQCRSMTLDEISARMKRVQTAAEAATGLSVLVSLWNEPAGPDDAVEIVFAYGVQRARNAGADGDDTGDTARDEGVKGDADDHEA